MLQTKQTCLLLARLLFISCIAISPVFSQSNAKIDSLVNVAEKYAREDTFQARRWLDIASLSYAVNKQKSLEAAEKALALSLKINQPSFIADSYFSKAICKVFMGMYKEAAEIFKQSLSIYEKIPNTLKVGECYMTLGVCYSRMKDVPSAVAYFGKGKILFEKEGVMTNVGICLNGIATAYLNNGQPQESVFYLQESIKIATKQNNKDGEARALGNLGMAHMLLSDYPKSLDYYQKALPYFEGVGQKSTLSGIYANISHIYLYLKDYQKSLEYRIKSLNIAKESNNRHDIANSLFNIGVNYRLLKDLNKALDYNQQAIKIAESLNDTALLSPFWLGMGQTYIELKDYVAAFSYIDKSQKVLKDNNDIRADNLSALGTIYQSAPDNVLQTLGLNPQERFDKSESAYLMALKYAEPLGDQQKLSTIWQSLSNLYETKGDYTKAYQAFNKYIALKDSISGDDVKKQITRKEIQFEFDKKETEFKYQQQLTAGELEQQRLLTAQREQDLLLNRQNLTLKEQALALSNREKDLAHLAYLKEQAEKQEKTQQLSLSEEREKGKERDLSLKNLELSAQQKQNLYLGLLAAVLLGGLGVLSYFYTALKKKNTIIAQQNELNEHTIAILSHDIKEPLLGVKLMLKKLNKDDPFVAQASHSLENQINSVNGILTNLLKMKKLSLVKKDKNAQADVQAVVKNVLQELNVAIQTKELSIENEITEGIVLPIAPEKLQIIVHNLLSNAVKYSFPNQKIRIFKEGKGFCIQDFGVGLSPEQRSKLMREVTTSQRGTSQEKGNGLGLFLIGAMLQGENIKVVFDSPEVGGTVAKVLG